MKCICGLVLLQVYFFSISKEENLREKIGNKIASKVGKGIAINMSKKIIKQIKKGIPKVIDKGLETKTLLDEVIPKKIGKRINNGFQSLKREIAKEIPKVLATGKEIKSNPDSKQDLFEEIEVSQYLRELSDMKSECYTLCEQMYQQCISSCPAMYKEEERTPCVGKCLTGLMKCEQSCQKLP